MKELSDITCCVVDHGLYLPLAHELAKSYKRVLYHNAAWVDSFPTLAKCIVGDGWYPEIEVIDDHWPLKNEIDLWVYPDLYHAGEQLELESQGKAVWGSRHGDKLEIYRQRFLKKLAEVGLEVPPYKPIEGLANLRNYLRDREDQYIKISRFRGTLETSHWRDQRHDSGLLDQWAIKFGPTQDRQIFLVFDAINTEIEVGADTYSIDGIFPELMLEGFEAKDKGYFGTVKPAKEMPEQLQAVNEAFAPELKEVRYRNLISSEVRIKGDHFYFIDPTRRFPCPGGGAQMKIYGNLPEIIRQGAEGVMVQPDMTGKYATEVVLTAKGDRKAWTTIDFPEELKDSLICGGSCNVDGVTCWPPDDSHSEDVAWLVNIGDDPKQTIMGILDKAKLLPDGVHANTDCLAELLREMQLAEEEGVIDTNGKLPEPAVVLS